MANLSKSQQTALLEKLGLDPGTPFEEVIEAATKLQKKATKRPRRMKGVISADKHGRLSISGLGCTFWRDDIDQIEAAMALARSFIADDAASEDPKLLDGEVGRKIRTDDMKAKKAAAKAKAEAEAAAAANA